MAKKKQEGLSRRDFIKWTGSGALAAGVGSGPFFLFPERAAAEQKTLKILQWSHFVSRVRHLVRWDVLQAMGTKT